MCCWELQNKNLFSGCIVNLHFRSLTILSAVECDHCTEFVLFAVFYKNQTSRRISMFLLLSFLQLTGNGLECRTKKPQEMLMTDELKGGFTVEIRWRRRNNPIGDTFTITGRNSGTVIKGTHPHNALNNSCRRVLHFSLSREILKNRNFIGKEIFTLS